MQERAPNRVTIEVANTTDVSGRVTILRLFISPAFWGIGASLIAICSLWTIWDLHQREVYLHSIEYKQQMALETDAWHQLRQQYDSRFRESKPETLRRERTSQ